MNNSKAEDQKQQAQREQLEAQVSELQAKLKEAGADTKIFLQDKLNELKKMLD